LQYKGNQQSTIVSPFMVYVMAYTRYKESKNVKSRKKELQIQGFAERVEKMSDREGMPVKFRGFMYGMEAVEKSLARTNRQL